MILDFILFHKLRIIKGCVNHHPNGHPLCLLFLRPLEILSFIGRGGGCGLCRTPSRQWLHGERKGALCEDGVFVGCNSWERKGALCEDGFFCWLQELGEEEGIVREWVFLLVVRVGEEKRALGEEGYLWPEEPIQTLLKKLLPKRLM
jgi:hypothetical protein